MFKNIYAIITKDCTSKDFLLLKHREMCSFWANSAYLFLFKRLFFLSYLSSWLAFSDQKLTLEHIEEFICKKNYSTIWMHVCVLSKVKINSMCLCAGIFQIYLLSLYCGIATEWIKKLTAIFKKQSNRWCVCVVTAFGVIGSGWLDQLSVYMLVYMLVCVSDIEIKKIVQIPTFVKLQMYTWSLSVSAKLTFVDVNIF